MAKPLAVVARQHELDGGEEVPNEMWFLIRDVLVDTVADRDRRTLEFGDTDGDAIDVEHQVGQPGVAARDRDYLGDGEAVGSRILPVDQVDSLSVLLDTELDPRSVAE